MKNKSGYFMKQQPKKKKRTQKQFKETCLDWDLGLALPSEQPQSSPHLKSLKDLISSRPDKT